MKMTSFYKLGLASVLVAGCLAACGSDEGSNESPPVEGLGGQGGEPGEGGAPAKPNEPETCTELTGYIDDDTSVGPGCVIVDQAEIDDGATLTVAPGTDLRMKANSWLEVRGGATLIAKGTASEPIRVYSNYEDPAPGDWECLLIEGSGESVLEHVSVKHGGASCSANGIGHTSSVVLDSSIRSFQNVDIEDSLGYGLTVLDGAVNTRAFGNVTFANIEDVSLRVEPEGMNALHAPVTFDEDDTHIYVDASAPIDVETAVTWSNLGLPYRFDGHVQIWGKLTVEAGTELQPENSVEISDEGSLLAQGTAEAPIKWTSGKASPAAGDWGCLMLWGNESTLEYNEFAYGGSGVNCGGGDEVTLWVDAPVTLANLSFSNLGTAIKRDADCESGDSVANEWCGFTYETVDTPLICGLGDDPFCVAP